MPLKTIVLVKQVPDTQDITGEVMKPDGTVNRGALPSIVNPEDLNALEEAVRIREQYGGSVTALTMGPPSAAEAMRECYFRGADDVILLTDKRFASADTLATSYALMCTIDRIGCYDLIFCGRQAIDGDTGQVGPQLAEKLHINQLTFVSGILEVCEGKPGFITVRRTTERGYQILKSYFPVLLTVTADSNKPRSPGLKRILSYKNARFTKISGSSIHDEPKEHFFEWDLETINADPAKCGGSGSPTTVKKIETVTLTVDKAEQVSNTKEGIAQLIGKLRKEHIIG
jgi:electron transfer flavoprotein beta subunit